MLQRVNTVRITRTFYRFVNLTKVKLILLYNDLLPKQLIISNYNYLKINKIDQFHQFIPHFHSLITFSFNNRALVT